MDTWEDFELEAKAVVDSTRENASEIVQLLQNAIGLLGDGFSVAGNLPRTDADLAKMGLLSANFATLKCATDIALRGYYTQSVSLLRNVYENWIAFHYLTEHPDESDAWLDGGKRPPGHSVMCKALGSHFNPLQGRMRESYGELCRFTHTSSVWVLPQIATDRVPNEVTVHFGVNYDGELFKSCAYGICIWTGIMLAEVARWVPTTIEWHNRHCTIQEEILTFVDQMHSHGEQSPRVRIPNSPVPWQGSIGRVL